MTINVDHVVAMVARRAGHLKDMSLKELKETGGTNGEYMTPGDIVAMILIEEFCEPLYSGSGE